MTAAEAEVRALFVIPAKAGIQACHTSHWIPAFAGMTKPWGETAIPRISLLSSRQGALRGA